MHPFYHVRNHPREENSQRCLAGNYASLVLDCAYPKLDPCLTGRAMVEADEDRARKLFFSPRKLEKIFTRGVIRDLWECSCRRCESSRNATRRPATDENATIEKIYKTAYMLLGLLILLDRLHLIHTWISWVPDNANHPGDWNDELTWRGHRVISDERVTQLMDSSQRAYFEYDYLRLAGMFYPVRMSFSLDEPIRSYGPNHKFPFSMESRITDTVSEIRIPREFVNREVRAKVKDRYKDSEIWAGTSISEYRFAKKIQHITVDNGMRLTDHMPLDIHRILEKAAKIISMERVITIVGLYEYQDNFHFVFPFVETNLQTILEGRNNAHQLSQLDDTPLPSHTLWKEMVGACKDLATIHMKLNVSLFLGDDEADTQQSRAINPPSSGIVSRSSQMHAASVSSASKTSLTRVSTSLSSSSEPPPSIRLDYELVPFHFDLKPANILVTSDAKLKISDFGQGLINLVKRGDRRFGEIRPGDHEYRAPESCEEEAAQTYDVWQLACILLEVVVFILDGGADGVRYFRQARREEYDDEEYELTFFDAPQGTPKLKGCVEAKINSLGHTQDPAQATGPTSPVRKYLNSLAGLLTLMFDVSPQDRISSQDVADTLDRMDRDFASECEDAEDPRQLLRALDARARSENVTDDYNQVGWHRGLIPNDTQAVHSFDNILHVRKGDADGSTFRRCRLRLWKTKPNKEELDPFRLHYSWFDPDSKNAVSDRWSFETSESFYPMYLQQPPNSGLGGRRSYKCQIAPRKKGPVFDFDNLEDVLHLQAAILGYKVQYRESQSLSLVFNENVKKKDERVVEASQVQVWYKWPDVLYPLVGMPLARQLKPPELSAVVVFQKSQHFFLMIPVLNAGNDKYYNGSEVKVGNDAVFRLAIWPAQTRSSSTFEVMVANKAQKADKPDKGSKTSKTEKTPVYGGSFEMGYLPLDPNAYIFEGKENFVVNPRSKLHRLDVANLAIQSHTDADWLREVLQMINQQKINW